MTQQLKRQCNTGTDNEQYDLISVIYHSLQSVTSCDTYVQDAEASGDRELLEFFQHVKEQNSQQVQRAEELMTQRWG